MPAIPARELQRQQKSDTGSNGKTANAGDSKAAGANEGASK